MSQASSHHSVTHSGTVVMFQALPFTHHSLTESHRATSSPARSIHSEYPIQVYYFLSFIFYFYCTISIFRCVQVPKTVVLQLLTVSSTVTCRMGLQPRSNRLYYEASVYIVGCAIQVCVSTSCDVYTITESLNDVFFGTYSHG